MRTCKECSSVYEEYGQKCSLCRPCKRKYDRHYYHNKLDKTKVNSVKNTRRIETNKAVFEYLSKNPCVICGENDPIVLEFDHIDQATKKYNVSEMMTLSFKKIEEEILKCRVLCANCHRRHTAKQLSWYNYIVK